VVLKIDVASFVELIQYDIQNYLQSSFVLRIDALRAASTQDEGNEVDRASHTIGANGKSNRKADE
jgi:hypothetical protein